MESDPSQLAAHLENNSMLVGCHSSPFKFPKNQRIVFSAYQAALCGHILLQTTEIYMDTNLSDNFSSSYFHKKLDNPTFLDFVDVFEYAWTHYTFNPVNLLLNSHCVHGEVAAMTLLCSYLEAIESYRSGEDSNTKSKDFFIKGFRVVFDKISNNTDIEAAAKFIYSQIRCGLSHEGMMRHKVNYIRAGNAFLLTCSKNPDGSLNFGDVRSIVLNPLRVRDAIQNHFKIYLATLREHKDMVLCDAFEKTARRLFSVGAGENIIGMTEQEFLAQV